MSQLTFLPAVPDTAVTNAQKAKQERDRVLDRLTEQAGEQFRIKACAFVLAHLRAHGETAGEQLTTLLIEAGIVPVKGDKRAYGSVYAALLRDGRIVRTGLVRRQHGHLTMGGSVYDAVSR